MQKRDHIGSLFLDTRFYIYGMLGYNILSVSTNSLKSVLEHVGTPWTTIFFSHEKAFEMRVKNTEKSHARTKCQRKSYRVSIKPFNFVRKRLGIQLCKIFFPRCVLVDGNRTFNLDGSEKWQLKRCFSPLFQYAHWVMWVSKWRLK